MDGIVALRDAADRSRFGGKASALAHALNAGLPVPDGLALSADGVAAVLAGDPAALELIENRFGDCPVAVRSSCLDEDGASASFAGAHESLLGQRGTAMIREAVAQVEQSGSTAGAMAYRSGLGLAEKAAMAIVIQEMVPADIAGVMFTRNPMTGACERVIEATWGLGESVVAGLVTPDNYRVAPGGKRLERILGEKDMAIRMDPEGGTTEVDDDRVHKFCLSKKKLRRLDELATACDSVYGDIHHDVEFAFRGKRLFLLQRRPITRG